MARTNLPTHTLVPNNGIAAPAGTAIDQVNGMNVQIVTTGVPAAPNLQDLILFVDNTEASNNTVIIRAGSNPPAYRSTIGDLTYAILASSTAYLGPFETARFVQSDGSLNVDFGAGITGTITALLVPHRY